MHLIIHFENQIYLINFTILFILTMSFLSLNSIEFPDCLIPEIFLPILRVSQERKTEKFSTMNGISSQCAKLKMYDDEDDKPIMIKKPLPLKTVSWSDSIEESDLDVPGTPRTPRTSTTKGTYDMKHVENRLNCHVEILKNCQILSCRQFFYRISLVFYICLKRTIICNSIHDIINRFVLVCKSD